MVLTLPSLRANALSRVVTWSPRVALWLVLGGVIWWFAVVYTADGLPSPYGVCYASRGRPIPCAESRETVKPLSPALIVRTDSSAGRR